MFVLKNIFGLHIEEIGACTLISQEALYKSINRAKKDFQQATKDADFDSAFEHITEKEIVLIEEILYAIFNIGFDSFSQKNKYIFNEALCLEAVALAKILLAKFKQLTTKNLLAHFCFHLARIPAKIKDHKIISFFQQDKTQWNKDFMDLGFYYLQKPSTLNKYYVEALIACKHMTAKKIDISHWNEIIKLYQLLLSVSYSPITKLNLCYCLSKAQRMGETKELWEHVENELPNDHLYLCLVKATIFKNGKSLETEKTIENVLERLHQKVRRDYILEHLTP
ncbi:DUF6596 domain-containing protein [Maribacter sp. 2307ULW6-5]|uniref:DUF6596 domain-containing protein n=1 Tax=Maribacter sp. 2307ULW6-5 TaxID=3386275 RepID=UPI0039BCE4BE